MGNLHSKINGNTVVLRVPKPNLQVIVLGLIALITLFQTIQLMRISAKASSVSVKAATTNSATSGTGSNTEAPQSMVGGC